MSLRVNNIAYTAVNMKNKNSKPAFGNAAACMTTLKQMQEGKGSSGVIQGLRVFQQNVSSEEMPKLRQDILGFISNAGTKNVVKNAADKIFGVKIQ